MNRACVAWAVLTVALGGCAGRSVVGRAVPRLTLQVGVARRVRTAARDHSELAWAAGLGLRWRRRHVRRPVLRGSQVDPAPRPSASGALPCLSAALCAWERAARASAWREVRP